MAFLNVKNRAESTLAADITSTATTLNVAAGEGARFPASNFHFTIGDEIIHCATRTADTFNSLTRAREGTTAAAHLIGAKVELRITAKTIDDLKAAAPASIMTTKGDIIVRDATAPVRLPVGPNDQVLTADSAAAGGMKWATVSAGITKQILFNWAYRSTVCNANQTVFIDQIGVASSTEGETQTPICSAGTFKNWYFRIRQNSLNGNTTFIFRKNGINQSLSITVSTGLTGVFFDVVNSFTVAAGDLINVVAVTGGTTGNLTLSGGSVEFIPN